MGHSLALTVGVVEKLVRTITRFKPAATAAQRGHPGIKQSGLPFRLLRIGSLTLELSGAALPRPVEREARNELQRLVSSGQNTHQEPLWAGKCSLLPHPIAQDLGSKASFSW